MGSVLGAIRGISERDRRIGTWPAESRWLSPSLVRFGVLAFLEEARVWYGIVSDSEPNKDFLLVNAAYKKTEESAYVPMDVDGVLLNFAGAESMAVIKEKSV